MEITYLGHSCFKLKNKSGLVLFVDPYKSDFVGETLSKDVADVLLISHNHDDHNAAEMITGPINREKVFVIDKEGEYEIAGVLITALKTYHDKVSGDERGKNLIFSIIMDGMNVVHLGDLGHNLSSSQVERLGSVDIMMTPVGGSISLTPEQVHEVVKEISPSYLIPMHYKTDNTKGELTSLEPLSKFLEKNKYPVTAESVHKIKLDQSSLPDDTQVLLMNG